MSLHVRSCVSVPAYDIATDVTHGVTCDKRERREIDRVDQPKARARLGSLAKNHNQSRILALTSQKTQTSLSHHAPAHTTHERVTSARTESGEGPRGTPNARPYTRRARPTPIIRCPRAALARRGTIGPGPTAVRVCRASRSRESRTTQEEVWSFQHPLL